MSSDNRRVVVGVSDSLAGLEALRFATSEARMRGASLIAIRTWAFRAGSREPGMQIWRRQEEYAAARTLANAFDVAMGGPPDDIAVEMMVAEGIVEHVLVATADRRTDLLVLGGPVGAAWHVGRTRIVRFCTRRAACPVLVVPPPELARHAKAKAMARSLWRETEDFSRTLSRS